MNLLKIILGLVLIGVLPSFWVIVGGASIASLTGFPGILLVVLWIVLLIVGIQLIFQGLSSDNK